MGGFRTRRRRRTGGTHLEVVSEFLELFTDAAFCKTIAGQVGHSEAEIIANMLEAHGGQLAARVWMAAHIDSDVFAGTDPAIWHDLPALDLTEGAAPAPVHGA